MLVHFGKLFGCSLGTWHFVFSRYLIQRNECSRPPKISIRIFTAASLIGGPASDKAVYANTVPCRLKNRQDCSTVREARIGVTCGGRGGGRRGRLPWGGGKETAGGTEVFYVLTSWVFM